MINRLMKLSLILLTGIIVTGFVIFKLVEKARFISFGNEYPVAIWEWRSPLEFSTSQIDADTSQLQKRGVSVIYLSVSDAVDLMDTAKDQSHESAREQFKVKLQNYISIASLHNIKVQALVGGPKWSDPSDRYLTNLSIQFVMDYNKSVPESDRLTGLQLDIEPFGLPEFGIDKNKILQDYIQTVNLTVNFLKQAQSEQGNTVIELGFVIPYWLDGQNGNIPVTIWNGKKQFAAYHIFDELASYTSGYIVLLSYRNQADGTGGSIDISKNQMAYITDNFLPVKVIIGQELNNVTPGKITFYGKNLSELKAQTDKIYLAFHKYPPFAGIAIHEVRSFLNLLI